MRWDNILLCFCLIVKKARVLSYWFPNSFSLESLSKRCAFPQLYARCWRHANVSRSSLCTSFWSKYTSCFSLALYGRIHHDFIVYMYIIHLMSDSEGNSLFSRESWCFPRRSRGKHQDWRENKTNWFPEEPGIKCFVTFLAFHFNSNERITGANQNSLLGTYDNTNLILKTTEWMINTFLILSASFSSTSRCFSSGMTLKIVAF